MISSLCTGVSFVKGHVGLPPPRSGCRADVVKLSCIPEINVVFDYTSKKATKKEEINPALPCPVAAQINNKALML